MFIPENNQVASVLMFITMCCWGSWANTQKLVKTRFELFYFDYALGVLLASCLFFFTLGGHGSGLHAQQLIHFASWGAIQNALLSGVIFNAANLLLVAAIALCGMAVAFPVAIGIALVMGTFLSFLVHPAGHAALLSLGVAFILLAVLFDAKAYKKIPVQQGKGKKGLTISVLSGILMGTFYPLIAKSMQGEGALDPYSANLIFSLGVFLANIPMNAFLMKRPLEGAPIALSDYASQKPLTHLAGLLGGGIWALGMMFNLVASHVAGPAIAYAFGQGATLIAAIWGVFVWREFKNAKNVNGLLLLMFVSYGVGLYLIYAAN